MSDPPRSTLSEGDFVRLLKTLNSMFPGMRGWLAENSESTDITTEFWYRTLRTCTFDECMNVFAEWADGNTKPFFGYAEWPFAVKSAVQAARDAEMRLVHQVTNRKATMQDRIAFVQARARVLDCGVSSAFQRLREHWTELSDGKITAEQYEQTHAEILQQVK